VKLIVDPRRMVEIDLVSWVGYVERARGVLGPEAPADEVARGAAALARHDARQSRGER